MKVGRRGFLKIAGITSSAGLLGAARQTRADAAHPGEQESAMLVDTTLCAGCRACEAACSEANQLPPPPAGDQVFDARRSTSADAFTVVNRFDDPKDPGRPRYAKSQCMHCVSPACASACPVRALQKTPAGPVIYDGTRCIGCRYCMVACPFGAPKYQYEKAAPFVRKCGFCAARQAEGKAPACASVCPSGALTFGKRGELLEEARRRIYQNPDRYAHHVYGEHEAGGTDWLYLSDVPFEKLAMNAEILPTSYPALAEGALGVPPVVMALWPPLLMGLYAVTARRQGGREKGEEKGVKEDGGGDE